MGKLQSVSHSPGVGTEPAAREAGPRSGQPGSEAVVMEQEQSVSIKCFPQEKHFLQLHIWE